MADKNMLQFSHSGFSVLFYYLFMETGQPYNNLRVLWRHLVFMLFGKISVGLPVSGEKTQL